MADTGPRRHDAEIREGIRSPAQKLVPLLVALIFEIHVDLERARIAEAVHHHGMVDDEIDRDERIDFGGVAVKVRHRIAHRGEVDDGGHAREVLHQHTGRTEGNFTRGTLLQKPLGHRTNIVRRNRAPILEPQEVFQQNFQRIRQCGDARQPVAFGIRQREVLVFFAFDLQCFAGLEAVERARGQGSHSEFSLLRAKMHLVSLRQTNIKMGKPAL